MTNKYTRTVEDCLTEMFRRVGEKYPNPAITQSDDWYMIRSWTKAEQEDFREWMDNLLKKRFKLSKKQRAREIGMFLLNWGWTTRE